MNQCMCVSAEQNMVAVLAVRLVLSESDRGVVVVSHHREAVEGAATRQRHGCETWQAAEIYGFKQRTHQQAEAVVSGPSLNHYPYALCRLCCNSEAAHCTATCSSSHSLSAFWFVFQDIQNVALP